MRPHKLAARIHSPRGPVWVPACLRLLPTGLLLLAALAAPSLARAEILEVTLDYPLDALQIEMRGDVAAVRWPGADLLDQLGAPALPRFSEQVLLPPGMIAQSIAAVSLESVRRAAAPPEPAQRPALLGTHGRPLPPPARVSAEPAIYEGSEPYPAELALLRGTGRLGATRIAACEIHPVQYDPQAGELIVHTRIALRLEISPDPDAPVAGGPRPQRGGLDRLTRALAARRPLEAAVLPAEPPAGSATDVDPNAYQYVIVTAAAQEAAYAPYAAWKTAKGVPATVVTVESIDAIYPGRDLAEKVRNFLIEAVDLWGTSYALLGGDAHIVPTRAAWAFDCEAGMQPDENEIPCDLYFADLDGTWDANGNDIFGEVDDEVDLYPDLLVGRAPTDDAAQAAAIVGKFLTYERDPVAGHAMDAFFFASVLWSSPYTDASIGKEMLASEHFTAYEPIERRYETLGNDSRDSVLAVLENGTHLTNHAGHAWFDRLSLGSGSLYRSDGDALTNGPHFFVLYSIGCWAAALDENCIAERFAVNGNGGTIAFVGNSRYGWGSPGNPGWGYSETFDRDFYGALLSEGLTQFGAAVAWPKILRIPFARQENVYRWHEYQVLLLGDPEMACHTAPLQAMTLAAPAALSLGTCAFTATLADADGPVIGARLCLAGEGVYQVGFSDACGQVRFAPTVTLPQTLTLTATDANHAYQEQALVVAGEGPFLTQEELLIDDDAVAPSAGNADGEIGPGETIELRVTLHNYGGQTASGVEGTLTTEHPAATIVKTTAAFGDLAAGATQSNTMPFVVELAAVCPPGEIVPFELQLTDGGAGAWTIALPLPVVAPGPTVGQVRAVELVGDGDGLVEPGESAALQVAVLNSGSGNLSALTAHLTSGDPTIWVWQGSAATTQPLDAGASVFLTPAFEISIGAPAPAIGYGTLAITFTHDEGTVVDSVRFPLGAPGFGDDMESGENGWTHGGTNDEWRLSDARQHSGTTSWYCGTAEQQYVSHSAAELLTPLFVAPEEAELSLWCYYDVTIYGSDGLFIDTWCDGEWVTLDYLGSGGALGATPAGAVAPPGVPSGWPLFVCDWSEYRYALPGLLPGETTQLRFRFESDGSDVDEGIYIDDVSVIARPASGLSAEAAGNRLTIRLRGPNPARGPVRWSLMLPEAGPVAARLYDANGRLIRTLLDGMLPAGIRELRWDGRTQRGDPAAGGVYFLRLNGDGEGRVTRLVRVR